VGEICFYGNFYFFNLVKSFKMLLLSNGKRFFGTTAFNLNSFMWNWDAFQREKKNLHISRFLIKKRKKGNFFYVLSVFILATEKMYLFSICFISLPRATSFTLCLSINISLFHSVSVCFSKTLIKSYYFFIWIDKQQDLHLCI
jgi:hypothetical protein